MTPHLPPAVARVAAVLFGPEALAAGPFSLLGLPVGVHDAPAVDEALARRLEILAARPPADAFEHAMVEEALRMTAERLKDPQAGPHLAARWTTPARGAVADDAALDAERRLEADAYVLLSLSSGWNPRVLRRLAWMAHARGIPSSRVAEIVRRVIAAPGSPAAVAPAASVPAAAVPPAMSVSPDRWSAARTQALVVTGVVVASLLVSGVSIALIAREVRSGAAGEPRATSPAPPASEAISEPSAPPPDTPVPLAPRRETPRTLTSTASAGADPVEAIRSAGARAAAQPERALVEARDAVGELAATWPSIDRSRRRVAHAALVGLMFAPAQTDRRAALLDAIAAPLEVSAITRPEQVTAAAWSAGMLTRLSRERNLPAELARRIDAVRRTSLPDGPAGADDGFDEGVRAGLAALVAALPPMTPARADPEALWDAWLAAARAATDGADQHAGLLTLALSRLAGSAAEPTADPVTLGVMARLTDAVDWSSPRARRWLVGAFDAAEVSSADLFAITSALARATSRTGVDLAMVLSTGAGPIRRTALRDEYRALWQIDSGYDRDALVLELAKESRAALDARSGARSPDDHLAAALRMARCSLAARRLAAGQYDAAVAAMERARVTRVSAPESPMRRATPSADDGRWAVRYLSAGRHIPNRTELLSELRERGGVLGPVDAETLLAEAVRGSPREVRDLAQQIAVQHAGDPAMVNAMLEILPTAPATRSVADLIGDLAASSAPRLEDAQWRTVARTRLVERLLELLAESGPWQRVDLLSEELARVYEDLAADAPPPSEAAVAGEPAPLDITAGLLRVRWRDAARAALPSQAPPLSLDEIDATRAARLRLATGPVQRFVVEQGTLAGYLAAVVSAERPHRSGDVRAILESLDAERAGAGHILEQVAAGERALLALWLVRFDEEAPS